jgi:predicted glycoside hydrolase/deacetylase ChbG (UPF0249 family)
MKQVVIVSDDFGFTEGINRGCIDALQNGILTEMSFMVDSPGSSHGVKLIKENNIKQNVGIHLTLNDMNVSKKYLRAPEYDQLLASSPAQSLQNRVKDEFKKF